MKFVIYCFLALILTLFLLVYFQEDDHRLHDALDQYHKGEIATSISDQKKAFNQALDNYLKLENEYHPSLGTGKLYYNIANTYFQLGEYPLASFYYHQAKLLMPRSEKTNQGLIAVNEKLNLQKEISTSIFRSYLSPPERFQLFFILSLIAITLASLYIWYSRSWLKNGAIGFSVLIALFAIHLIDMRYFSPIEAILIHATEMRQNAGSSYTKVNHQPIPAGSQVEVLDVTPDGNWLKIKTLNDDFGYVPKESLLINF